jgi:DNA polymerase-3 subunit delta'
MLFRQVIGQQEVKGLLRQIGAQERVPHATILLGPPGSGTLPLAIAWASMLLCLQPENGEPCGTCPHCAKSLKLIHPDLHFSFPTVSDKDGGKTTSDKFLPAWRKALEENPYFSVTDWLLQIGKENKQGNITKEECLSIYHKLNLTSFESSRRILIMWLPEYLGKEGNRLLKLIEEPPKDTYFILVAENMDLILPTILSRCQIIKVPPLQDAEIIDELHIRFPELGEKAPAIAYLANGNFNEALELAREKESVESGALLHWIRKTYAGKPREILRWSEEAAAWGREKQKHFLLFGLHFLRELLLLRLGCGLAARLQGAELDFALKFTPYVDEEKIEQISRLWAECIFAIERNANAKILFLDTSIQMNYILKGRYAGKETKSIQISLLT